jgi:hypothetical protein
MIPDIAPVIADALAKSRLITISGGEGGGAANSRDQQHRRGDSDGAGGAAHFKIGDRG